MDKNTTIGLLLIGLVFFLFTWLNRPNQEQIEAQRRYDEYMDSLARVEQTRLQDITNSTDNSIIENTMTDLTDSVKSAYLTQQFGAFAQAAKGVEEFVTLENDKVELKISSKGGRLTYARLKEYTTYDGRPLVLFDGEESTLNFMLKTTNRVINTSDLYFTPIKEGLPNNSITMRLLIKKGNYINFNYTLTPDNYILQ